VEPKVREFPGNGSPLEYVLSLNLHRRHLDESQRAMVAGKIATLKDGQRKAATSIDVPSQPEAAKMLNVGVASVQRARKVLNSGNKELISKVEQGEIAVSKAAATIAPPKLKVVHDPAPVPTTNVTTTITPDTSITTRDTTKKFRMLRVYLATQVGAIPEEQRGEFASELEKIATEIRENGRVS
jgi:predicted transcriptional regulator